MTEIFVINKNKDLNLIEETAQTMCRGDVRLTWVEDFLCLGMAGTEGAVQLEVVRVVQERSTETEQNSLETQNKVYT